MSGESALEKKRGKEQNKMEKGARKKKKKKEKLNCIFNLTELIRV